MENCAYLPHRVYLEGKKMEIWRTVETDDGGAKDFFLLTTLFLWRAYIEFNRLNLCSFLVFFSKNR